MSKLTEVQLRAAKPREKPYKLRDGRGLHLLVSPSGGRLWRFRYRFAGRENMLSLGPYPEISLQLAREKREDLRRLVARKIDPSKQRLAERLATANTFEAIALEWLAKQEREVTAEAFAAERSRLERFIFPELGKRPVAAITVPELLAVLRRIEARGHHETARRTRALCSRLFRYAVATGRAEQDVSAGLRGTLTAPDSKSFAALTEPGRIGALLRAIDGYVGQPATHAALRLAPLVFVRPGELRGAEWREFDLAAAEWRIPGERMKMREQHIVPLATQAVDVLTALHAITGRGRYVFPSVRSSSRPLSENTLNAALRRLGYAKDEMTTHGFRAMASTLLNEQGFAPDVIELQLAHAERNKVRAAYNRAQRLEERRRMMQAWANYLDGLRAGGNVVSLKRSA